MRFAMHNWMRPEPLEVTVERLARYGYDAIEIMGEPTKYEPKATRVGLLDAGIVFLVPLWGYRAPTGAHVRELFEAISD